MTLQDEIRQTKPFETLEQEAYLNLIRTANVLQGEAESLFKEHGLTATQYNVLRILRGSGAVGLPTLEISRRLVTRVPDITRLIDRMVKAGFVERRPSARDRRVVYAMITEKARRLVDDLDKPVAAAHRRQFTLLTEGELITLNALLEKARSATISLEPTTSGKGES